MNKLSKDVFAEGMQKLIDTFTFWKVEIENPRVMATWYEFFKDWKDETFSKTIDNYIKNESIPPTVKGIYDHRYRPEPYDDLEDRWKAIREKRIAMGLDPDIY